MISRRRLAATVALASLSTSARGQEAIKDDYILGVDNSGYPGDEAIKWFQESNERRFVGLYLTHWNPKNNAIHEDGSWISKRQYLAERGWGFLPCYMGKQPPGAGGKKYPIFPMSTAQDGTDLGNQAAALMKKAGFQTGSVVYLDVEAPVDEASPYLNYIKSWQRSVAKAGYYPGLYCSHTIISWARKYTSVIWGYELPMGATISRLMEETAAILDYDPLKYPHGIIYDGAIATQYTQNKPIPGCPKKDDFDCNSALVADPSNLSSILWKLNQRTADPSRFDYP